jgi:precorrin-6A/cobalt-precorrin-6A reductase
VLARVVDPPEFDLPTRWRLLVSRGPYDYSGERQLLADHACDLLVTKDSGGRQTSAKLDAAADLGIRVIVINRPAGSPGVETVGTVVEVLAWLESAAR